MAVEASDNLAEVELSSATPYSLARDEQTTEMSNGSVSAPVSSPVKTSSRSRTYQRLSPELEEVFLTMHYRKMQRDLNGPQKKKTKYHFIALACMLILIYGLSAYNREDPDAPIQITLSIAQIAVIGVWIFLSIVITAIFGNSKFIVLLYWMLIYWPLLAMLASILVYNQKAIFGDQSWIAYALIVVEVVTLIAFVLINYVYPKLVTSKWFRETYGASRFFRIILIDDWTMEYDGVWGRCSKRYVCRYVGELRNGLPHGQGVWSDDSYNGEVLTGTWKEGKPIAPFSSRQYGGKGNTFSAVRLAFYMATDDTFEANKLIPTNEDPPRCGVSSVECSIAGEFYSHLPEASLLIEPQTDGLCMADGITIGKCCRKLGGSESSDLPLTELQISSNDPRGVQVGGHLFYPTGLPFTKRIKQIVIDILSPEKVDEPKYTAVSSICTGTLEVSGDNDEEKALQAEEEESKVQQKELASPSAESITSESAYTMRLNVKNWVRVGSKEALIFIPGFNSWLKHSLETFGQMVAMTNLSRHVFPILYAFPGGQVPTYRHASFASATENNRKYFLQLLRGLQEEGIQNIHIVTHSLGVQTLMNAFEDTADGSPSLVSQCFGPAPSYGDQAPSVAELGKLVCRSITMLNPDFPVLAFREHGFRSIRRVASLITVVGDKTDQALWWSSVINGTCNFFGYVQPSVLDSEVRKQQKGYNLQQPIGRDIESLHLGEGQDNDNNDIVMFQKSNSAVPASVASRSAAVTTDDENDWLDCDVIDTTGLDTNVNNLRHAAFSVNSILLRDIEELVVTGKRASERTTLLWKKGNVYEYCHAPSFVTPG